jgi:hypothetical protein
LRAASVAHDIPIIVVRDDADWTRLAALARTAVAGAAADSVSGVRLGDMFAFANAVATMTQGPPASSTRPVMSSDTPRFPVSPLTICDARAR